MDITSRKNEKTCKQTRYESSSSNEILKLEVGPGRDEVLQWLLDEGITKCLQVLPAVDDMTAVVAGPSAVRCSLRGRRCSLSSLCFTRREAMHSAFDGRHALDEVGILLFDVKRRFLTG